MAEKVKVGIIGCGAISGFYLRASRVFKIFSIAACSDADMGKAESAAEEFSIPCACTVDSLLADKTIGIVLNLTPPAAHAQVALKALEAGKSVYNEKPLALSRKQGREILELARKKSLLAGCAPDTFMGAGGQTCRKIIDGGMIGAPAAAAAFMMSHGPEAWHPNPSFYYKPGGGPLFDMGPYYITALINLMGPVEKAAGFARASFPVRVASCKERMGEKIKVETPTHIAAFLGFRNGAHANMVMSFDVWASEVPRIEIYGEEGTLSVPDPNTFNGPVRVRRAGCSDWEEVPLTHGRTGNWRGVGVADMAYSIVHGRPHRASGEMAFHVLDIMESILESSQKGAVVEIGSSCGRPAPIPECLPDEELDD